MSFVTGTASSVSDLLTKLDAFLTVGHSLDPVYSGSGTGIINGLIGTAASILETITITFSSATDFAASGSVSGSLGSGAVGTAFTCSVCAFTIADGGTSWASGDTITFIMTPPWEQLRFSTVSNSNSYYCCWQAPGNDGDSEIYVSTRRMDDITGDYDNLRLNGYTAYNAGLAFFSQPGGFTSKGPLLPLLRVGTMPYWFIANGRRAIIVVKVSSVYIAGYLGLITPYINPMAMPYPLLIGGSMAWDTAPALDSVSWRWSYTGNNSGTFPKTQNGTSTLWTNYSCRFRRIDGLWTAFSNAGRYPEGGGGLISPSNGIGTDLRAGLDGSYPLFPIILSESNPANVCGELDGVAWVSGHGNAAENVITQNRISWLVVQDVFRTAKTSYFAVKLS
jgi:hypothetical protein